jgi:hypothetical protein
MDMDYFVVDVFTDRALGDNPLAVVMSPDSVKQAGPAICSSLQRRNRRGSSMCAWRAAPFLLQRDSFSCRDAHAFNRF